MITKKALVTGATGFLGQHLCHQLSQLGWQVFALCRSHEKSQVLDKAIEVIIGDILNPDKFKSRVPDGINAIFHTAASTNMWSRNNSLQTKTNLTGTKNMLNLALEHKIGRFIHVSSVVVFGIHTKLKNITEEMPKAGASSWINYVKTKTISEKMVLEFNDIDTVVINPTHIIGPGDKNNWAQLIKMIAMQKLPSIPNGSGSFVDVRDVANGIINAYEYGKSGENYLLGGTNKSFKQFVHIIANKFDVEITKLQLANTFLNTLASIKNLVSKITNKEPDITLESVALISDIYACDSAKAKSELKFNNRDFNETLDDTINYLKDENIINLTD